MQDWTGNCSSWRTISALTGHDGMQQRIDLNADLGEGCGDDLALLKLVTSANITCGAHAGDRRSICAAINGALEHNVAIGAHPSWPDRANFGRTAMTMSAAQLRATIHQQLDSLAELVTAAGGRLSHVKPHGALYNQAASDIALAQQLARCVHDFDRSVILVGLAGGQLLRAAAAIGQPHRAEAFADRAYAPDGTLVPRTDPRALLGDSAQAVQQCLDMICRGQVVAVDGTRLELQADTLCVHGDTPGAVHFAWALRDALIQKGIEISHR